jgi:hypothetical protein
MKIIEKEFNIVTGEETITERNETAEEKNERLDFLATLETAKIDAETKAAEKAALLKRLGITAEEAALLLA